jgi:hypothetical protein
MKSLFQLPEMDMSKMMAAFKMPQLNPEQLMAGQQKNMEAIGASGQLMMEGMQAIAQRQAEMFQQMMAGFMANAAPAANAGEMEERGVDHEAREGNHGRAEGRQGVTARRP